MAPQVPLTGDSSAQLAGRSSSRLLEKARLGDASALDRLVRRYLPGLFRWAHGRLPRWTRAGADTSDLVQDAVLHTLPKLSRLDLRGRRVLGAYLRKAVHNRIQDEHRRHARRGPARELSDNLADPGPSPLERAIGSETERRYRAALARLNPEDSELIVGHIELDYSHEQLGCMTGRSPNAARMALQRAIRRLAEQMRHG